MGVILREGGKWRKVSNGAADEAARRKDCACAEMASCWKAARGAPSTLAVLHQSSLPPSADSSAPLRLLTDTCALLLTSSKWERLQKAPRKFGKRSDQIIHLFLHVSLYFLLANLWCVIEVKCVMTAEAGAWLLGHLEAESFQWSVFIKVLRKSPIKDLLWSLCYINTFCGKETPVAWAQMFLLETLSCCLVEFFWNGMLDGHHADGWKEKELVSQHLIDHLLKTHTNISSTSICQTSELQHSLSDPHMRAHPPRARVHSLSQGTGTAENVWPFQIEK